MFNKMTKKIISTVAALTIVSAMVPGTASAESAVSSLKTADGVEIFVAPNGKDSNDGSFSSPLATIQAGINKANSVLQSGKEAIVTVRGGEYKFTNTFALKDTNSGTEATPFIIQSYQNEEVNINAGVTVKPADFTTVTDGDILDRLPENSRGYIGELDLTKYISSNLDTYPTAKSGAGYYELIVNGNPQAIAKWPNTGWAKLEKYMGKTAFYVTPEQAQRWATSKDTVVDAFFGNEYMDEKHKIVIYGEDGLLTMSGNAYYGIGTGNRYKIMNLVEELDTPGEYYIEQETQKLYYYPPTNLADANIVLTTNVQAMMTINSASNITVKGLNFLNTRGAGIVIENSKNIIIDDCKLQNVGNIGVNISASTNCQVKNSTISGIGGNGIVITNCGDRPSLTSGEIRIENNHIYDFAKNWVSNTPGINLSGDVGTVVQNNVIHDSPSQAMWFASNNLTVKYNEMYNVVNDVSDAGAIYSGRNYTMRGNEIAYNYIHDIDTTATKTGSIYVAGLYYDDLFSTVNTHHNILANCHLGIMIGGGRDHYFENNIVVDCDNSLFFDARGVGWGAYHAAQGGQAYNTIFAVPYTDEIWATAYPELATIFDNPDIPLGIPNNNTIKDNLLYNCPGIMVAPEMKEYGVYENNLDTKNYASYFKDYKNANYEISESSGLLDTHPGLAEIDMSKIGLSGDKAAEEVKSLSEQKIALLAPTENEVEVTNLGYEFKWERHNGCDSYIVKIANDPEMTDVIIEVESWKNYVEIKNIPAGGKTLYWMVEGVSTSPSLKSDKKIVSDARKFVSVTNEQRDTSELEVNLEKIQALYDGMTEGTELGTFKTGFKQTVKNVLDKATLAVNSENTSQVEVEEANTACEDVISSVVENYNYNVVMMGDLLAQQDKWMYPEGFYTWNEDGSITLKGDSGRKNHYDVLGCDIDLGRASAVRFRYNVNVGSNYCIIGLQPVTTGFLSGGQGYNLIIKSNQIEVQKYVPGNLGSAIKDNILNFYISDNKWVDLEMGAFPMPMGTYVYLMADGYLVSEYLDTEAPYWDPEVIKFVATNPSGAGDEYIISVADPVDKSEWNILRTVADDTEDDSNNIPNGNNDNKDDGNKPKPEIKSAVFKDVGARYEWAIPAIDGLYKKGIISGKTSDTYAPADNVTRAEFLKLIMRAMGFELKYSETFFEDVTPYDWYYTDVVAASSIGLVNGLSDTYFGANDKITRQDAAVLISRAFKITEKTLESVNEPTVFDDKDKISAYAVDAINDLTSAGILRGSDGKFNPKANCTRAEAAVMLKNVLDKAK